VRLPSSSDADVQAITQWLASHGFSVTNVTRGRSVVEFSGTAQQVTAAFHTEIHKFLINGEQHWANASDPAIPAALAPVVAGVASLHDFKVTPQSHLLTQRFPTARTTGQPRPQVTLSDGEHALVAADFNVIYGITNDFPELGINGAGTTIGIVARSDIDVQDIADFRLDNELPANAPQIIVNGPDPGDVPGDDVEATLDASWAGVIAPFATVDLVISASTNTTDGVFLSEIYIIEDNTADLMSESFSGCEAYATQDLALAVQSLAEQAAAQGITYVVAAGDAGSAGCDDPDSEIDASGPLSVNVLASTPYTVAVGGTEFNEHGQDNQYWSTFYPYAEPSALSYIPEDVWNESCSPAQCLSPGIWAGGGGSSIFYSKPAWQYLLTPNDGWRDVPDVAFTAASHDPYLICLFGSCEPDLDGNSFYQAISGTSASTPAFAGIMALVVGSRSRQGNPNPVLYGLAAQENFGGCNGSNTAGLPGGNCIFNDVTVGNNGVFGEPNFGTSLASFQAGPGYDLATGLGSLNVQNLIRGWPSALTQVPGSLTQLTVGVDGSIWGINATGSIYTYNVQTQTWMRVPGALTQIAVGNQNAVWGLNSSGSIYQYNPAKQTWVHVPGALSQIAVGWDGDVWGINGSAQVYHWIAARQTWQEFTGISALQIAVGFDGSVWAIDSATNVEEFDAGRQAWRIVAHSSGTTQISVGADGSICGVAGADVQCFDQSLGLWHNDGGPFIYVAVGSSGQIWAIDAAGRLNQLNTTQNTWTIVPGAVQPLLRIAVAANGAVVGIDAANNIYSFTAPYQSGLGFKAFPNTFSMPDQIVASSDGRLATLDAIGQAVVSAGQSWNPLSSNAQQVTVQCCGNVWWVDRDGSIFADSFLDLLPGSLTQIAGGGTVWATDPNTGQPGYGETWGLNSAGGIYRWDRDLQTWDSIPGTLAQIAVGADDTVVGINAAGNTYLYDQVHSTWKHIPGTLAQVSVGSISSIWGLNATGQIYHYNSQFNRWDSVPGNLSQISAGFDGEVWGVNEEGQIYRYDPVTTWDQIPGTLAQVGVGSDGAIWGIDAFGSVYRYSY